MDWKIKSTIVEIRGRRCQWVLWDSQLVFSMVCWRLYGVLLEQYIQEINHCDKLHDYENLLSQWLPISHLQSNLGSRTPRIMNNSVYKQIFQAQSVSDDILCLALQTLCQWRFCCYQWYCVSRQKHGLGS